MHGNNCHDSEQFYTLGSASPSQAGQTTQGFPSFCPQQWTVGEKGARENPLLRRLGKSDLRRRGLTDVVIDHREYRSLPRSGRVKIASELHVKHGDFVLGVPGVIRREKNGEGYLSIAGSEGLLIPVRDIDGRIVALKIRRDADADGSRYTYLSSKKYGGPGPSSSVYIPFGITAPAPTVRLTEGELKADIAYTIRRSKQGTTDRLPGSGGERRLCSSHGRFPQVAGAAIRCGSCPPSFGSRRATRIFHGQRACADAGDRGASSDRPAVLARLRGRLRCDLIGGGQ